MVQVLVFMAETGLIEISVFLEINGYHIVVNELLDLRNKVVNFLFDGWKVLMVCLIKIGSSGIVSIF